MEDMAYKLSTVIPSVISTEFNPCASRNFLAAAIKDLALAMRSAVDAPASHNWSDAEAKRTWLQQRGPPPQVAAPTPTGHRGHEHGSLAAGPVAAPTASSVAVPPLEVPEVPEAVAGREEIMTKIRKLLGPPDEEEAAENVPRPSTVTVVGMGGSGKVACGLIQG